MIDHADLIARLRDADRNSVQRVLGSRIFGEAADAIEAQAREIERLRIVIDRLNQEGNGGW